MGFGFRVMASGLGVQGFIRLRVRVWGTQPWFTDVRGLGQWSLEAAKVFRR